MDPRDIHKNVSCSVEVPFLPKERLTIKNLSAIRAQMCLPEDELTRSERIERIREQMLNAAKGFKWEDKVFRGLDRDDDKSDKVWAFLNRPTFKTLPLPVYALEPGLLDRDNETELQFYAACETKGCIDEVMAYVSKMKPSLACLQFGLEQASFGGHLEAVRFLLQLENPVRVPLLHSCAFGHYTATPKGWTSSAKPRASIFSKVENDLIALLEIFIQSGGWHPDNYWKEPGPIYALRLQKCVSHRPLLMFLLEQGADATRGMSTAIEMWDAEAVDILLKHGAQCRSLHEIVRHPDHPDYKYSYSHKYVGPPFEPRRRQVAERLLAGAVGAGLDLNATSYERHAMKMNDAICRGPVTSADFGMMKSTAFSYACEAHDWEFAEWLLEHGADPIVPEIRVGRAPADEWNSSLPETKIKELIEKVKQRTGRDIPELSIWGEYKPGVPLWER